MGKAHRDNHAARVKRGKVAFQKKAERRAEDRIRCNVCGTPTRPDKMEGGLCPLCFSGARFNPPSTC